MGTKDKKVAEEIAAEVMEEITEETEEITQAPVKDTRVEVFVPKAYANEDKSFYVGINGKGYNLPRGKRVMVPPEVAEEVNRAVKAQERYEETASARELKETK